MDQLTEVINFITGLSAPIQVVITGLVVYIMVMKISEFNEYKINRRHATINKTLSYSESLLKNIKSEAISNMKNIMIEARGEAGLSEMDKFELSGIRLSITESLEMQTKAHIKTILRENGYYRKIKENDNIDDLVHQRAMELRNISLDAVESVLRDSSPLQGRTEDRFSYDKSEKLFKTIIDKHYHEIQEEEEDINAKAKELFWLFSSLYKYTHDGIKISKE